jgi:hypothetical protein
MAVVADERQPFTPPQMKKAAVVATAFPKFKLTHSPESISRPVPD